mmetsp:Transcript_65590/g.179902  ORF Transcript_65590/g.179902 Transcript_65590/m.179902 type:complete len:235 (+) Transcript_65590:1418-2122(+)
MADAQRQVQRLPTQGPQAGHARPLVGGLRRARDARSAAGGRGQAGALAPAVRHAHLLGARPWRARRLARLSRRRECGRARGVRARATALVVARQAGTAGRAPSGGRRVRGRGGGGGKRGGRRRRRVNQWVNRWQFDGCQRRRSAIGRAARARAAAADAAALAADGRASAASRLAGQAAIRRAQGQPVPAPQELAGRHVGGRRAGEAAGDGDRQPAARAAPARPGDRLSRRVVTV